MKFTYSGSLIIMLLSIVFSGYTQNDRKMDHTDVLNNSDVELMASWPSDGPELAWEYEGLGNGYSAPAIDSESVFITGEIDSLGYLFSFNLQGKLIWKVGYGREWTKSYIGTRAAPTVVENLVYVCSAMGDIVCLEKNTGSTSSILNLSMYSLGTSFSLK